MQMKRSFFVIGVLIIGWFLPQVVAAQEETPKNPLWYEPKIKHYLAHMSWADVEEFLKGSDMAIIPLGSIEQHGPQTPLGTDFLDALELALLVAQQAEVVVAPALMVGYSEHHMGFPGTLTISTDTLQQVVFEVSQSLIRHGFKKIMLLNRHGGNNTAVNIAIQRINHETEATAVDISGLQPLEKPELPPAPQIDWHAGVGETSLMLYLTPSLVDMSKARKPVLTLPPHLTELSKISGENPNLNRIFSASIFLPKATGKQASSREMSNTGVFTTGNPADATAELGRIEVESYVKTAVKFIEDWRKSEGKKD